MSDPNDLNDPNDPRDVAALRASTPLNNFSHRNGDEPSISAPSDLVTEPSPAQRERIIYLVDDALDAVEDAMHYGKPETRLKAAETVLDRAGIVKERPRDNSDNVLNIPAEAIVQVVQGLAHVFGHSGPSPQPTPAAPPSLISYAEEPTEPSEPPKEPPKRSAEEKSGLPASLLAQYGGKD